MLAAFVADGKRNRISASELMSGNEMHHPWNFNPTEDVPKSSMLGAPGQLEGKDVDTMICDFHAQGKASEDGRSRVTGAHGAVETAGADRRLSRRVSGRQPVGCTAAQRDADETGKFAK